MSTYNYNVIAFGTAGGKMSVENWEYENREAGFNRTSSVIASIADSWSRCSAVSYTHLTLPTILLV